MSTSKNTVLSIKGSINKPSPPPVKKSFLSKLIEQHDKFIEQKTINTSKMPDNIVFVETKLNIHCAISFSQYIFNEKILITFIGELHKEKFKCDGPSISIAEYCTNAVQRNKNCRVFLEFNKDENIDKLNLEGSTLKETFVSLRSRLMVSRIIAFDERPRLITRKKQDELYWLDWSSCSFNEGDFRGDVYKYILDYYIEPFKTKDKIFLYESSEFINKGSYNQLQNYYQLFLQKQLFAIEQFIKDEQSKFDVVQKKSESLTEEESKSLIKQFLSKSLKIIQERYLQYFWAKVSDFYLLQELFTVNDCNECIVLLGEEHKRNICHLLDKFNEKNKIYEKLNDYNNNGNSIRDYSKKCINIFKTVMVDSIPP
jgi:hypothetical protein